ncbi:HNH endonuclease [Lysobacter solisilvae (ex Woo and Kim 2020)]|uniref:HNH endonuclease n=1 Tax=Agrilutibacter terrestris TaxID=2865112 RepID=A0A7H0FUF9_9GAMM|nr:HNH endonuclease signature motif containing protein [Lysobacter terrestris]QNP39675.1 HNH endonuclease [Lysobacter terrestris]
MAKRPFRGEDSLRFEEVARDEVAPFLSSRGLQVIEDRRVKTGTAVSQTVSARLPDGSLASIKVRLCWRRDGRNPREHLYSAAQLRARRLEAGWAATMDDITRRNKQQGVTHLLLFQRDQNKTTHAALVPIDAVAPIWHGQYQVSNQLIGQGLMGRIRKNHAANGHSPTIWLQDDRTAAAHAVPRVLWTWPGVIDLMRGDAGGIGAEAADDTFDDCPGVTGDIGSDGGERIKMIRSAVKRDPRVRDAVRARANGKCERCGASRDFPGFMDVHHIMGVEKSDRLHTCVALCPNCHREAHLSPGAEQIRVELTNYANQFKSAGST